MHILITLLCGVAALCPLEARAAEARMTIKAGIISYADWQRINDNNTIDLALLKASTTPRLVLRNATALEQFTKSAKYDEESHDTSASKSTRYIKNSNLSPQEIFRLMDINNDNIITRREYLISTGTPIKDSDFDQLDLNGDGVLSRSEVKHGLSVRRHMTSN